MRFSLSLVSTALLATLAIAAPAAVQKNSELNVAPAQTVALKMGEQFQPFNWMSVDGETQTVDRTFTLNLAEPAQLQVTDYKMGGDAFEIMDNGEIIGMTSQVSNDKEAYAATPEEALQDERFSHAVFDLAEGKHEITINVANSQSADGTGAVRLVQKIQALYDKKGGKGKGKKGWDDDDDEDWDDDDEDCDDDDDDDDWDHKKGGWGDKKGGWGDKKGGWDNDKWDNKKGWGNKKGWDKKKTVYIYYTVPAIDVPGVGNIGDIDDIAAYTISTPTGVAVEAVTETNLVVESATQTEVDFLQLPFLTV